MESVSRRSPNVVIVGASLAGLHTIKALRRHGFAGQITCIGDERWPPYDRPPLSKELLAGKQTVEATRLCARSELDNLGVEWLLGTPAQYLDCERRAIHLASGRSINFDRLVIATGASPVNLASAGLLSRCLTLRTLDDAIALRTAASEAQHVVIIGAGFIGLEVAATLSSTTRVEVVEAGPFPLAKTPLGESFARYLLQVHEDHGVTFRCAARVDELNGNTDPTAREITLADGSRIRTDLVLVAVGIRPNTQWLDGSGLLLDDGVVCDEYGRTSVDGIYAVGDVSKWFEPTLDRHVRYEHWAAATEQADVMVRRLLCDDGSPIRCGPSYFWSDQYGIRTQYVGAAMPGDAIARLRANNGVPAAWVYSRDGIITAALTHGQARLFGRLRRALLEKARLTDVVDSVTHDWELSCEDDP